jgi:hypothetical protein
MVTRTGDRSQRNTRPDGPAADVPAAAGWVRAGLWFGLVAVTFYVASWAIGGLIRPGYAPRSQAISELFELGAPWASRGLVAAGLVTSGIAFLVLAPALHRALPGTGLLGPVLVVVAGIGTLGAVVAPCSPGCPGVGTTATDTWHTVAAGTGYGALVLAPLAFGWRVRGAAPRLAGWSLAIGGVSLLLFAVYLLGVVEGGSGLQQRVFNSLADAWYVLVTVWALRRGVSPGVSS